MNSVPVSSTTPKRLSPVSPTRCSQRHHCLDLHVEISAVERCEVVRYEKPEETKVFGSLAQDLKIRSGFTPGGIWTNRQSTLLHSGPSEFLVISSNPLLARSTQGFTFDQTQAVQLVRVTGKDAPEFMTVVTTLDLRDSGRCYSTRIHSVVSVQIWMDQESVNVLVPRSFAQAIWQDLMDKLAVFQSASPQTEARKLRFSLQAKNQHQGDLP